MKITGVLLDFNGTLFFDSPYHELAWKAISKEIRGIEMSDEELRDQMHGKTNENVLNYLFGKIIDPDLNKQYSLKKESMYRALCIAQPENFHLAKGVEAFLNALVQHAIPFTIVSASIKENIDFFVTQFQLDRFLDPEHIIYDDGRFPTKIEMFKEAAKQLQVDIHDCLVIEDSVSGIKFAHEANVAAIIAVDSTHSPQQYLQFPFLSYTVKDFDNFPWKFFEFHKNN